MRRTAKRSPIRITESRFRQIIKETLAHMAAAAAAGHRAQSSGGGRSSDSSERRSGESGRLGGPWTYAPPSENKIKQMYADAKNSKFFRVSSHYDHYSRQEEYDVVMEKDVDETEIVVDMKIFNRDEQVGGFTKENYKEWVNEVCPLLRHSSQDYKKFENIWLGLSLTTESKLRQIIRNVIRESLN